MTQKQSNARLWFYIVSAMLSAFTGGVLAVDFSDWRKAAVFAAGILGAGITAARGYVDTSTSRVETPPSQTMDFTKFPPMP